MRCPHGHPLEDTVGDNAAAWGADEFVCGACEAVDAARRARSRQVHDAGSGAEDLLDGRYWTAVPVSPDA